MLCIFWTIKRWELLTSSQLSGGPWIAISLYGLPVFTCMPRTSLLVVHIGVILYFCSTKMGRFDSGVNTHESIYELNCESSLMSYNSSHDLLWGESWLESSNHLTRPFTERRGGSFGWHKRTIFSVELSKRIGIQGAFSILNAQLLRVDIRQRGSRIHWSCFPMSHTIQESWYMLVRNLFLLLLLLLARR